MTTTTDPKPDTAADGDHQADTPTAGDADAAATGRPAPATGTAVPPVGADGAPTDAAADGAGGAPGTPPSARTLTLAILRRDMLAMGLPESTVNRYRRMGSATGAAAMEDDDGEAETTLRIDGPIIDSDTASFYRSWYGESVGMDPQTFSEFLKAAAGRNVTLLMNSPGGYVDAGADITSQVQKYAGQVTCCVMGDAASMGSCIAAACDTVQVADMGMFMLHPPWGRAIGNAVEMRDHAKMLDVMGENMITIYAKRMGDDAARAAMTDGKDHWYSSADSLANGLADEPMPTKNGDGGNANDDADDTAADDDRDPMDDSGPTAADGTMPPMPQSRGATGPRRTALLHMTLDTGLNPTHRSSDHATQI